jgi:hypothetical protein
MHILAVNNFFIFTPSARKKGIMLVHKKFLGFACAFLFFLSPLFVHAQTPLNAGMVQGIWFSDTAFVERKSVRIYSAIQNQSGVDIAGTAEITVDETPVATREFSALNGRIIEVWADHAFTPGPHSVGVRIVEAYRSDIGAEAELASIAYGIVPARAIVVDSDTDSDGIGNVQDNDDDNDGISDEVEKQNGTNPLDSNDFTIATDTEAFIQSLLTDKAPKAARYYQQTGETITETIDPLAQNLKRKADNTKEGLVSTIQGFKKPDAPEDQSLWRTVLGSSEAQLANTARLSMVWLLSLISFILKHWVWSVSLFSLMFLWFFFRRRFGREQF